MRKACCRPAAKVAAVASACANRGSIGTGRWPAAAAAPKCPPSRCCASTCSAPRPGHADTGRNLIARNDGAQEILTVAPDACAAASAAAMVAAQVVHRLAKAVVDFGRVGRGAVDHGRGTCGGRRSRISRAEPRSRSSASTSSSIRTSPGQPGVDGCIPVDHGPLGVVHHVGRQRLAENSAAYRPKTCVANIPGRLLRNMT